MTDDEHRAEVVAARINELNTTIRYLTDRLFDYQQELSELQRKNREPDLPF